MSIILKNATYIDWKTLDFSPTNLLIEEGENGKVEQLSKIDNASLLSENKVIDCTGKYVTKSFAIGHHHVYSALARGMPAPKQKITNFHENLKYIWWTLDKALTTEMIEASALATALECAKNGVTFVIDHHASPFAVEGSLETLAKAFEQVGVSHLLCYEISDRDGTESTESGLRETENYLQKHQGLVGLHAAFTIGDKTLKKAVNLAEQYQSGIHIHVAEDLIDQKESSKNHNLEVVKRLHKHGVLDLPKSILVHCLHINDEERKLIANSPAWVAQNTESNLKNDVGFFNSTGLGNDIMIGTDGMHSDILRSAKAAFLVGQSFDIIDYSGAYERFRNVHRYIESNGFTGDGANNLVILDYPSPTPFNKENFFGHFIFGLDAKHVQHVISDGKLIVEDRKVTMVNEADIFAFSKEMAGKLWEKL